MSLTSIFSVARTALNYQQAVIQTAGHNIANAETEGFSRQRVDAQAATPQRFPYGSIGTGVAIDDIRRARDVLLDQSYRREASGEGAATLRHELLGSVEQVLGEPSDDGLSAAMDAFWSSWSELANQPTSQAARSVVQQRARNVATQLNTMDARLTELRAQTATRLDNALTELNGLAQSVAELNGRIVSAEVGGQSANDLRDQRDLAIDRMSKLGETRVLPQRDGSVTVLLGNNTIVDGVHAQRVQLAADGGPTLRLALASAPAEPILSVGGAVQTLLDFQNGELAETQERMDAMANTLARAVNAVHQRGNDGTALAPYDAFFVDKASGTFQEGDPFAVPPVAGVVTARNIALAAPLERDASRIAATSSRLTSPAGNDVALAMAGLRSATAASLGGVVLETIDFTVVDRSVVPAGRKTTPPGSMADFFRTTASALAAQVKDAEGGAAVRRTLLEQADARRNSVSGVNVDEELTTLMRAQQAYAAAAKVITAADEMMQTLIGMI
ncbi:flagellar hook-associated protein FlgK [Roseisolibacter sp. H3M3-2]|uniref:flagellar hook-associated protein FlgK n=1 Tax=Roseisolibacter sp. H3M3-2 TaxID=3031323 RepID=UPI0023DCD92B|nr:flagellar hook-associated protein FlgK [Roseisolibacter sp. H3M3-2]MDF1505630.1 flagellar hook-associated protein FlgK [Roseisolibacter sp. H3M3-2]